VDQKEDQAYDQPYDWKCVQHALEEFGGHVALVVRRSSLVVSHLPLVVSSSLLVVAERVGGAAPNPVELRSTGLPRAAVPTCSLHSLLGCFGFAF